MNLKKIVSMIFLNDTIIITNVLFFDIFCMYIHFKEKKECFFAKIKKTFPGTIQNKT